MSAAEVASGFRCKRAGFGSGFVVWLCGGGDSFGLIGVAGCRVRLGIGVAPLG